MNLRLKIRQRDKVLNVLDTVINSHKLRLGERQRQRALQNAFRLPVKGLRHGPWGVGHYFHSPLSLRYSHSLRQNYTLPFAFVCILP